MPIYALDGQAPEIAPDVFVAETAIVIGKVRLKPGASVWFGAVVRGDNEWIEIGEGSNVQDLAVLHTDIGSPLTVGANCTVGHQAMLHGCTVGDTTLIGMGAVVLNDARIGARSVVGAHALVGEGKSFEDGQLIVGVPARAIRPIGPEVVERLERSAAVYRANAQRYVNRLVRIA